jgi:hypothetical protein
VGQVRGFLAFSALPALVTLAPAALAAESAPVPLAVENAVELHAGQTCLEESRLEGHVLAWLGRTTVPATVHVIVQGDERRPGVAEFTITRGKTVSVRRFDALPAGCEEAHAAVGLAIALAIDANVLRRIAELAPPPPPFRLFVVQAGFGYDVLPRASFGGRAGLEHELFDRLSGVVELGGQYAPKNRIAGTTGTFDAMLVTMNLKACFSQGIGGSLALRIALCAGGTGGALHAAGSRYAVSESATGVWAGALTGLRADFTLGIRWALDAELAVPFWAPSFRVARGDDEAVRELKVAGFLVNLGPALAF